MSEAWVGEDRTRVLVLVGLVLLCAGVLGGVLLERATQSKFDVRVSQPGLTYADPDGRFAPGFLLVPHHSFLTAEPIPSERGLARLVDKEGNAVHDWNLEYPIGGEAIAFPNGDLMYVGRSEEAAQMEPSLPGMAGVIQRVDASGDVLMTHVDVLAHHDFDVLPDGTMAYIRWDPLTADESALVQGGLDGTEDAEGRMWADSIVEVSPDGTASVAWRARDALDPESDALDPLLRRSEWTHLNSLQYVERDPLRFEEAYLISSRQLSEVMLISRSRGDIIWRYGGLGRLHQQHDPRMLDNGNVIVFDNGPIRMGGFPTSRVVEIDPRTDEEVWTYEGTGLLGWRLFSSIISGVQRLPNGNTMITEGLPGRMLEVTEEGDIVWEYQRAPSPWQAPNGAPTTAVFKTIHYPESFFPFAP